MTDSKTAEQQVDELRTAHGLMQALERHGVNDPRYVDTGGGCMAVRFAAIGPFPIAMAYVSVDTDVWNYCLDDAHGGTMCEHTIPMVSPDEDAKRLLVDILAHPLADCYPPGV